MSRNRIPAILTALLLGLALLSGCGSSKDDLSGLSTSKLLSKASAQVKNAKYVKIAGKVENSGNETALDLSYVGKDSHGTITLGGTTLELESVDGTTYFKPSDDFWKQQMGAKNAAQIIKVIDGRWIIADPKNQNFAQLVELASRDFVTKEILKPDSKVTKGKGKSVNGVDCITLDTSSGTLYLDQENARPVQIVGKGSDGAGKADFSYGKIDAPTAPAKDEQVDLAQLGG